MPDFSNKRNKYEKRVPLGLTIFVFGMTAVLMTTMALIIYHSHLYEPAALAAMGIIILIVLLITLFLFIRKVLKQLDQAHDQIEFMTITDDLTQLINRKHFNDLIRIEVSRARRYERSLSCLMLGLDNFRKINEKYGLQCGDRILKEVAEVIRENSRITDVRARDHGDKFVCLFPETDFESTFYLAKRLLALVERSEFLYGDEFKTIHITTSIGITSCKPSSTQEIDAQQLIQMADKALDIAKQNGKNRVEYFIG